MLHWREWIVTTVFPLRGRGFGGFVCFVRELFGPSCRGPFHSLIVPDLKVSRMIALEMGVQTVLEMYEGYLDERNLLALS
jgi:hypothetical protein